jgi:hypothetical protein
VWGLPEDDGGYKRIDVFERAHKAIAFVLEGCISVSLPEANTVPFTSGSNSEVFKTAGQTAKS